MNLCEKYRPRRLSEMVGQPQAVAEIEHFIRRGKIGGRAFWFQGPPGVGKTSMAYVIGCELGVIRDRDTLASLKNGSNFNVQFYQSQSFDVAAANDLRNWIGSLPWPPAEYKMAVIDEAHTITDKAQNALLSILEPVPSHAIVCLTTTDVEASKRDAWGSRLCIVDFVPPPPLEVAKHLATIACLETGDGAELPYGEIIEQAGGNIRGCVDLLDKYV